MLYQRYFVALLVLRSLTARVERFVLCITSMLRAGQITVNSELNKLARNISFGHGVHAGIHWRTDTDTSMLLGEAMAISYLQDRAQTYNEKFTVNLTRLDGSTATITNE